MDNLNAAAAEVLLRCGSAFDATLAYLTEIEGGTLFRVSEIFPADKPREAALIGSGLVVRLTCDGKDEAKPGDGVVIRLLAGEGVSPHEQLAPNGTVLRWVAAPAWQMWLSRTGSQRSQPVPMALPPLVLPAEVVVSRDNVGDVSAGRAGMLYRDLVPCRLGGALVASSIRIPKGGPVPDYVHFHVVRFQIIYCVSGWARLVYEDQGEPFILRAGDLVLQPPTIRHRVLESSDGLEVMELGVPAEHITRGDQSFILPNRTPDEDVPMGKKQRLNPKGVTLGHRCYGGQQFCYFDSNAGSGQFERIQGERALCAGLDWYSLGVGQATRGVADVCIGRTSAVSAERSEVFCEQCDDILLGRVNRGTAVLEFSGEHEEPIGVNAGDTYLIPRGRHYRLSSASDDLEVLHVRMPKYIPEAAT
eukprot:TRINITY_DN64466_c0_g1_i1.p1 TRINITY_DN64466_c0_g1~~TRINITY_DN64466_c0_g1_i1.p1  ORF type:complete len:456 (-),score=30.26 TRINITY_DN64466_c0_g1_i1:42-1295(-)